MQQYLTFSGTSKRQEYWAVVLITLLIIFVGLTFVEAGASTAITGIVLIGLIGSCWALAATTVRRLRDAGLSVWWIILIFIPYVSFVAHIVFGVIATKPE